MNARVFALTNLPLPDTNSALTMFAHDPPGGGLALVDLLVERGSEPPLHRYQREDLGIYVLEGEVTFHVAGRHQPAATGDCVLVPRGTEHGYSVGSARARLLVAVAPAGAERYLAGLHDSCRIISMAGDGEAAGALERLIATAAHYGIEITGPRPGA